MSNTDWSVIPNISINGMLFGTDRNAIRKCLGKPKSVFKKTPDALNTTDAYAHFHVFYSADDKLEAIEVFGNEISLSIDSQMIFPGTLSAARKILPDIEGDYGFFESKSASVGISAEEDMIVSILVGGKGYYK